MKNPADRFDAVNKAYADRIKYKTNTGNIPNTVMTDLTLFTFPPPKAFASEKIKICEMWVERLADEWIATSSPLFATEWLADEWIATSSPLFATEWPGFHKLSRGLSLMTVFTGSPTSAWTCNFRLDYVELP